MYLAPEQRGMTEAFTKCRQPYTRPSWVPRKESRCLLFGSVVVEPLPYSCGADQNRLRATFIGRTDE
jgi:hypothetical protein